MAKPGDIWAFCGSLPPGAPVDLYGELISILKARGALAFLDTSEGPLRASVSAGPVAIKPNSEEAAQVLGYPVESDEEHIAAAQALQALGSVRIVALTRGARGLVLAMDDSVVSARPPAVEARSPIGAGDAAFAGLIWAACDHVDIVETARRAVACGTAAAMQEGTGVGSRELITQLMARVEVE